MSWALLYFAGRLSRSPADINRADWDRLLEAGWRHQQAVERIRH
jgi:hypothetical protein